MSKFFKGLSLSVLGAFFVVNFSGCTKKPSQEEVSKLEEARVAAESAEKKLSELRQERMQLEQELQSKQSDLSNKEGERDSLKANTDK